MKRAQDVCAPGNYDQPYWLLSAAPKRFRLELWLEEDGVTVTGLFSENVNKLSGCTTICSPCVIACAPVPAPAPTPAPMAAPLPPPAIAPMTAPNAAPPPTFAAVFLPRAAPVRLHWSELMWYDLPLKLTLVNSKVSC